MRGHLAREYFRILDESEEFFERALEVARRIAERAEGLFGDCEVYVVGSFARGVHTLSSDLDVLIVSDGIPDRVDFEWYYDVVKALTSDHRVNVHLLSRRKFRERKRMYAPMIRVKWGPQGRMRALSYD